MNPIISPAWIYLIHLVGTIYDLSIAVLVISVFALIFLGVTFAEDCLELDGLDSEKEKRLIIKGLKICFIAIIVSTLLLVIVPDKKTLYGMVAASMITPDNISGVEEHVIDLITKIADAVYNTEK